MAKKKKIPKNSFWYRVYSPLIPNEDCFYEVAAKHEDQATTIISKMFKINVYVDDERTSVTKIRKVDEGDYSNIDYQEYLEEVSIEGKVCPNPKCGYIDESIGSDTCPGCGTEYSEESYSILVEDKQ